MPDIIKLLPDHVANQIAAGEVILRPASVVKELMENAVDAGATQITLIIKDAGKSLIQVIDNGSGMSEMDARMSLERHATSKIRNADDLFAIRTMGFRGEALASIAAISHLEIKTRRREEELGNEILVEGSNVKSQQPVTATPGTSFSVRNLFYNVPARRNFLKSDQAETHHIIEEFIRVALVNQKIGFIMQHNQKEVFHLKASNLKQRIVQLFNTSLGEKLVPVEQETAVVSISGFAGKPEHARKTRGEQYFFVNGRFIRHPYFHHAVDTAYRQLVPEGHFPSYFIFFTVDPATLDVNIHPTKTEVKFLHDKVIYSLLHSTIRLGLGKFHLTPSLDFDVEQSLDLAERPKGSPPPTQPQVRLNPDYNPFHSKLPADPLSTRNRSNQDHWERLFHDPEKETGTFHHGSSTILSSSGTSPVELDTTTLSEHKGIFQVKNRFLISNVRSGMLIVDQQRAHERILFEKIAAQLENREPLSQQDLFPSTVGFSPQDADLLRDLLPDIRQTGFVIEESLLQEDAFVVSAVPVSESKLDIQQMLEEVLESFKNFGRGIGWEKNTRLAASIARTMGLKAGTSLSQEEMNNLLDALFSCQVPNLSPDGLPTLTIITADELSSRLR